MNVARSLLLAGALVGAFASLALAVSQGQTDDFEDGTFTSDPEGCDWYGVNTENNTSWITPVYSEQPVVLDLGTGPGLFLKALADYRPGIRAIGVECAP